MSPSLSDRELDRLLADLPRQAASAGFSRRVLDRLDAPPPRRRARRAWLLAAAAAAASALAVGVWLAPRPAAEPPLAETRALQAQHRQLMEELTALKASLRDAPAAPVIYVGGNEQLDLVLDLGPVWRGEAQTGPRPAVYDGGDLAVPAGERPRGERR